MTAGLNFRDLIPPGQAARQALDRELRNTIARTPKEPGRVYSCRDDVLLQHGTVFTGRQLDAKWEGLRGQPGSCHHNSLAAAQQVPTLRYFTGLYSVANRFLDHSWLVDPEGQVVEVTWETNPSSEEVRRVRTRSGGPWTPPDHWLYCGVEYEVSFVEAHSEAHGLGILQSPPWDETATTVPALCHPYSPAGFPL